MRIIVVILCIVSISCAVPINEFPTYDGDTLPVYELENGDTNGENAKRVSRQVAVNVGPVGVGVGPFGGVGVRVGPLLNIGVGPSYPVAYPAAVPVYPAAIPLAYSQPVAYPGYEYRSRYRYRYFY